ncbi:hypothetical protein RchiOBHm_Chr0c38g0503081 [Rosa chinensis]|uniref:Uncharacterized protein n=1 Tax=Rosa chinensis TaxID=74649 RepID=A0A2P6SQ87_ROSCH|nr:UPF0496 protein At4g34320 [Rosa chinensis]XP_024175522.1 UPF0496 protein At4g34320 [Rosa chinensis]PRQ23548.1 hypothetical protein RchiOBHm_Chr6g0262581 [Rosa chinensis]PRQ60827.1 hypothetical protein RchiOBHm_Chr0c38g0503081 [Rosa chinensis]
MGMKGVRKLSRKIFKNVCNRDGDLWRSYEDACKNEKDFLTELGKFLESYEKCLIQIKKVKNNDGGNDDGYMRILEKLKNVKGASGRVYDQHFAHQILCEKVECLKTQREDLHDELTGQKEKPRKKYDCTRAWRRCLRMVTHILFIGAAAAEFACTVVAAVLAAPLVALAIAAAIIPTLAGQHWTLSWIEDSEIPSGYSDSAIRLMESKTMRSIKDLGEIQTYLCRVVKDKESLTSDLNSVIEGDEDINMKTIERLLKDINELKERARNSKSKILEASKEVS